MKRWRRKGERFRKRRSVVRFLPSEVMAVGRNDIHEKNISHSHLYITDSMLTKIGKKGEKNSHCKHFQCSNDFEMMW